MAEGKRSEEIEETANEAVTVGMIDEKVWQYLMTLIIIYYAF